jgi:hypothetical protein
MQKLAPDARLRGGLADLSADASALAAEAGAWSVTHVQAGAEARHPTAADADLLEVDGQFAAAAEAVARLVALAAHIAVEADAVRDLITTATTA